MRSWSGFLIISTAISIALVWTKAINFKLLKVECRSYTVDQNISCVIRKYEDGQTACDMDIQIDRPVYDVLIHFEVWKKLNGLFVPTPVNMTVNACKFISKNEKVPFHANLVLKWARQYSNINHTCPVEGHVIVRNLKVNNFRLVIPDGEYRMDVRLYEKSFSNPLILVRGYGRKM